MLTKSNLIKSAKIGWRLRSALNMLSYAEISRRNLSWPFSAFYKHLFQMVVNRNYISKIQYRTLGFCSCVIETCAFCNRKCSFCFNSPRFPKRDQGFMQESLFRQIVDELSTLEYCGRLSPHLYGEPMLDPRLPSLIKYAKSRLPNCYIELATNGDFLNDDVFKTLVARGADHFLVTNYDDEENHNLIMLSKKYPSFITLRSYKELTIIDRAGEILRKNSNLTVPCLRPSGQVVIDWKGNMLLCCQDFYARYRIGNIAYSSMVEIWNSLRFSEYRKILKEGRRSKIKICKHCDYPGNIPW